MSASPRNSSVSVLIVTYNHERYIQQAVQGVLNQTLKCQIVIGEDCSTDGTRSIVQRLAAEHPGRIHLLCAEENQGAAVNTRTGYAACQGEYVALLEGDDYWTDPEKLSRQASFLDAHPECALCFHPVQHINEHDQPVGPPFPQGVAQITTINDLFRDNYIQTCSIMLRKSALPTLPLWFADLLINDWPLCILAADRGYVGLLPRVMAHYRLHAGGVWSSAAKIRKRDSAVKVCERLREHFGDRHRLAITNALAFFECELALAYEESGNRAAALTHLLKSFEYRFAAHSPHEHLRHVVRSSAQQVLTQCPRKNRFLRHLFGPWKNRLWRALTWPKRQWFGPK